MASKPVATPIGGVYEVHVSQKTGLYYFFLNGRSLWHDPSLPAGWGWKRASPTAPKAFVNLWTHAEQAQAPIALAAPPAAPPPAPPPHAPYAALNASVLSSAGVGVVALRAAVEALCAALARGALAPPRGCAPGLHRFPPLPKQQRAVCHELADEFGLRSESAGEEPDGRHVVVWREDAAGPPEAAAAAAEEAVLAAQASARVAAERAADAARAAAEAAAAGGGGSAAAAALKGGKRRSGAGAGAEQEEDLIAVVPIIPEKMDRRDYKEIREEIEARKKRARVEGGGGGKAVRGEADAEECEEEEEEEELERG
jgi:hypothetical protein